MNRPDKKTFRVFLKRFFENATQGLVYALCAGVARGAGI